MQYADPNDHVAHIRNWGTQVLEFDGMRMGENSRVVNISFQYRWEQGRNQEIIFRDGEKEVIRLRADGPWHGRALQFVNSRVPGSGGSQNLWATQEQAWFEIVMIVDFEARTVTLPHYPAVDVHATWGAGDISVQQFINSSATGIDNMVIRGGDVWTDGLDGVFISNISISECPYAGRATSISNAEFTVSGNNIAVTADISVTNGGTPAVLIGIFDENEMMIGYKRVRNVNETTVRIDETVTLRSGKYAGDIAFVRLFIWESVSNPRALINTKNVSATADFPL